VGLGPVVVDEVAETIEVVVGLGVKGLVKHLAAEVVLVELHGERVAGTDVGAAMCGSSPARGTGNTALPIETFPRFSCNWILGTPAPSPVTLLMMPWSAGP
jgi:hypothetical protein